MSDHSKIEWTESTWNPVTGCTKVSPGCDHCYIDRTPPFRMQGRKFLPLDKTTGATTGVQLHEDRLDQPLRWKKPRRIFVNSLSDLFHDDVPDEYIAEVFAVMTAAPRHTYQVLTKRHARMRSLLNSQAFVTDVMRRALARLATDGDIATFPGDHIWLGVSVENQQWADIRIPALLDTPAAVRFLSCEPLVGPVDLAQHLRTWPGYCQTCGATLNPPTATACRACGASDGDEDEFGGPERRFSRPDWVIVGGESGPRARPMHPRWARGLRDQCEAAGVPYFFKQWGEWVGHAKVGSPWREREPDAWVNAQTGAVLTGDEAIADGGSFHGVYRIGKKAAGRELDGRTWDDMPARTAVSS